MQLGIPNSGQALVAADGAWPGRQLFGLCPVWLVSSDQMTEAFPRERPVVGGAWPSSPTTSERPVIGGAWPSSPTTSEGASHVDQQHQPRLTGRLTSDPDLRTLPSGSSVCHHQSLLSLLALPNTRLLRAAKVEDPGGLWRRLELPLPSKRVPTALCRHDPGYPEALAQLQCAPAVLYATCTTERLRELLGKPTVAILGGRDYTNYARQRTFELARDLTAAGVTVISGVNEGLEGIAHHGALHAHGNGSSSGDRLRVLDHPPRVGVKPRDALPQATLR